MANSNETAAFLGICLPFFLRRRWWYGIPAIMVGICLSHALQGAVIAASVFFAYGLITLRSKLIVYGMLIGLLIGIVGYGWMLGKRIDTALEVRGRAWVRTAYAISVKPWFGWGFGQYRFVMPLLGSASKLGDPVMAFYASQVSDKRALDQTAMLISGQSDPQAARAWLWDPQNTIPEVMAEAHNEFLEAAFCGGLILLIFLLAGCAVSLHRARAIGEIIPGLAILASMVSACMLFDWRIMPIVIISIVALVLIWGRAENKKPVRNPA
jgi:hypothetical protein